MPRAALLVLLLACLAPQAEADDAPRLHLDGKVVALQDGLLVAADGRVWITTADLRRALDVVVRRLIPRPPQGKRPDRRRKHGGWLLCGRERCGVYRGEVLGEPSAPSFEFAKAARLLGLRHKVKAGVHELQTPRAGGAVRPPKRARVGSLVPDVALTFLDGSTHRLRESRGKRLLLMTWASWSPTREKLEDWRSLMAQRAGETVRVIAAALDAEGAERARDYAASSGATHVAIDRHAALARAFPMTDVGHWYYIDELGVLRAEGKQLNEDALQWIDLHLQETPIVRPAPPARPLARVDLAILRERVQAEPAAITPRLALLEALGSNAKAERFVHAAALVEHHPKVAPFGFRLAAMHLEAGQLSKALAVLDAARRRTPDAWYLRKQYWALWQPARYYAGPIDTKWERLQRKLEDKEFGRVRRGRRRK